MSTGGGKTFEDWSYLESRNVQIYEDAWAKIEGDKITLTPYSKGEGKVKLGKCPVPANSGEVTMINNEAAYGDDMVNLISVCTLMYS